MSKIPAGKKDLSSKLAGAVRAAKTEHAAEPGVPSPAAPEVKPAKPPLARPATRQPRLDDRRGNLHPERIWPD